MKFRNNKYNAAAIAILLIFGAYYLYLNLKYYLIPSKAGYKVELVLTKKKITNIQYDPTYMTVVQNDNILTIFVEPGCYWPSLKFCGNQVINVTTQDKFMPILISTYGNYRKFRYLSSYDVTSIDYVYDTKSDSFEGVTNFGAR